MPTHRSTWITPPEAAAAMARGTGRGVKIAVIDSGIELSHPAMAGLRLTDDLAFTLDGNDVVVRRANAGYDAHGHGTAVAHSIRRVAPEAQIGSFRVMNERNGSKFALIQQASEMAVELGYDILNCSFGARSRFSSIQHFKGWIDEAYRRGVHVVAACDNTNFRKAEWPGDFPTVITVNMAKTDQDGIFYRHDEGIGDPVKHLVEFAARGVKENLPWKGGKWRRESGSSFAAPHVAGQLARLISEVPGLKPPVAKALLQELALPWTPAIRGLNK